MLHACVQKFDVTRNLEKFYKILETKQPLSLGISVVGSESRSESSLAQKLQWVVRTRGQEEWNGTHIKTQFHSHDHSLDCSPANEHTASPPHADPFAALHDICFHHTSPLTHT